MNRTGVVQDPIFMEHVMDPGHPESPDRLKVIYKMLEEEEKKDLRLTRVKPRPAAREELETTHSPGYIDRIASTAGRSYFRLDMDTSTSAKSYEAASLAAGGLCELIRAVCTGDLKNGFALVRPPGHHAERDRAMGFCLFNNVAIGAHYAIKNFSLERILIVDWDVHHGNGTQNTFYSDRRVLYFSTHRYGFFYPGSGGATEVGHGEGEGFTVNAPLEGGSGDADYGAIFARILKPIALEYRPQLVLVSAGFDIHRDDPLGGMDVSERGFARLTQILMDIAEATAQGKLVLTLEGGYDIEAEKRSVNAVLRELSQVSPLEKRDLADQEKKSSPQIEKFLLRLGDIQRRYWKSV